MRVLLLSDFYPPMVGGVEQHVQTLARELAGRGHAVTVATIGARGESRHVQDDRGASVVRLPTTLSRVPSLYSEASRPFAPPAPDPELTLHLARLVRRVRPDVVHAHGWIVHSYLPIQAAVGVPLVATLHDYGLVCAKKNLVYRGETCSGPALGKCLECASQHYGRLRGLPITVAEFIASPIERRFVSTFIAVSTFVAEASNLRGLDYEVIPNFLPKAEAVDADALAPWLSALPSQPFLLFVGALGAHKGFPELLEAYGRLPSPPPLACIGHRWVDTPKLIPPGVVVLEDWPHEAVLAAWERCLIGLVPSTWAEPFGLVALEAMRAGVPLIASRSGGLIDIVEDGSTGVLVPPGDAGALADAIRELILDAPRQTSMGANARQAVTRFEADLVVPRIEQVYRRVT
jgi:glycosyltransferase involved in cell wall biosynthesis